MNVILLSGGSGTRLWPLSNEVRSKQFLKIFKKEDGTHESMTQRMYRMIKEVDEDATVTIATSQNQVPQIIAQLGDTVGISVEPLRRDTFPAIALATAYLKDKGAGDDEAVVVCPVDPYVDIEYFKYLKTLSDMAEKGDSSLTLMGIEPTYPSAKYGYIIPMDSQKISKVKEFKEKPDEVQAQKYIDQGALWNAGVFAYKIGYVLDVAQKEFGTTDYRKLYDSYAGLTKISFDYAVVEKEKNINVIRFNGEWKDLGTWNTLPDAMSDTTSGNSTSVECTNTHIINELSIPLITMGINNAVVVATPDGILVADKDTSSKLKNYAAEVALRPMYEKRQWGEYKVLDCKTHDDGDNSLVKEIIISPGKHISYQYHLHRTEMWTFTEGEGELTIDGVTRKVTRGDSVVIPPMVKHMVKGITELHFIEIQIGDELVEEDIVRIDDLK